MPKKTSEPFFSQNNKILNWLLVGCIFVLVIFVVKYILGIKKMTHSKSENFSEKPQITVIYAFSKTCPFCIQFENTFDTIIQKFLSMNNTHIIDVQKLEKAQLSEKHMKHIDGFPTVLIYEGGNFVKKSVGKMPGESFMTFLQSSIS